MKSVALGIGAVLLTAALCASPAPAYDVVDELFGVTPTTSAETTHEVPSHVAPAQTSSTSDPIYGVMVSEESAPVHPAPVSAPPAVDHKPVPLGPISAVPEPSAVLLAIVALVYFLVFGRRRRMV
jgi:hypothetical protein